MCFSDLLCLYSFCHSCEYKINPKIDENIKREILEKTSSKNGIMEGGDISNFLKNKWMNDHIHPSEMLYVASLCESCSEPRDFISMEKDF